MVNYDDPPADYGVTRVLRARRDHTCYACDRTIYKGERYARHVAFVRGERPEATKLHRECLRRIEDPDADPDDLQWS